MFKSADAVRNNSNVNVLTLLRFSVIQKLSVNRHNFLRKNYQNLLPNHVNIFLRRVEIR
jgi:hypothetical protein